MSLLPNSILSGGLALGAIAAAFAAVRRYLVVAFGALRHHFVVDVEIRDSSMTHWLGLWLANTDYGRSCRRILTSVRYQPDDDGPPNLSHEPGPGLHILRYSGHWILLDRRQEKSELDTTIRQWWVLLVFGKREVAIQLLDEVRDFAHEFFARRSTAFLSGGTDGWIRLGASAPRDLASIVLPGTTVVDLADRVRSFLEARDWYASRGIPWRLGVGFWGPPRTGKSSLVRAITHELGLPLYVLDLTPEKFSDRHLILTLAQVPRGAAVLIEDIDAQLGSKLSAVTLSGLLNALDGPLASEGRVLFVTSNAPENLDAALLGEGRIDVHVHFGYADSEQVRGMFLRFFPGEERSADRFAESVPADVLPPAAIQEYLLVRSDCSSRALADAHLLARKEVRIVKRGAA